MKSTSNNNAKTDSMSGSNTSSKSDMKNLEPNKNQLGSKEGQSQEKKSMSPKSK